MKKITKIKFKQLRQNSEFFTCQYLPKEEVVEKMKTIECSTIPTRSLARLDLDSNCLCYEMNLQNIHFTIVESKVMCRNKLNLTTIVYKIKKV